MRRASVRRFIPSKYLLGEPASDIYANRLCQLYQNYARPFRLYEPILLILKTADTRIDDVLEAVWRQLLREAASRAGAVPSDSMAEAITELCVRYFPSEAAPLDVLLSVVYDEASQVVGEPGWASAALLDGGVPLRDLWEGVTSLYEEVGGAQCGNLRILASPMRAMRSSYRSQRGLIIFRPRRSSATPRKQPCSRQSGSTRERRSQPQR